MLSTLAVAWRTTAKRLAADWLIVSAAFVTIVLATVLLSSGPIYADAVTISALQQAIDDAPVPEAHLSIGVTVFPDAYPLTDDVVQATVARSLAVTGAGVYAHLESEAYGLETRTSQEVIELVSFQFFEGIAERATLTAGAWPSSGGPPYEVALTGMTAEALGLGLGDTLESTNRRDAEITASATVVGVFEVDDAADAFWFGDDLVLQGRSESASFRTYGPLVVTRETMLEGLTPNRATAAWRVLPQFENLSVPEVARLRASVSVLERDLDTALLSAMDGNLGGASAFSVDTGLPVLLADMDRSLTVTRSSVLALLIQLAILAGYALVLSAGLLTDTRRTETILLRSRGTSPAQVLMSSVLEGLLITVPAALAGPMLATLLLRILNSYGPLASIGLRIEPEVTAEAYILALIAACLSVVALSWPAYRSARSFPESARRHRRQQTRTGTQRLGVDLALLALTVVVIWQLQILGPQISARVRGQFGVDPLLVVAPALGLLTGAVLALRIIPMLARAAEWVAGSRRSVVAALASWQVARRPARYARSSLLLIMAVSIGFFAASYSTTWVASQREQAHHAVGADIALVPNRSASVSLTDLHLADAHGSIPGIDSSMPVQRLRGQLSSTGEPAQFVLLDAAKAADIVGLRSDLATEFPAFMEDLVTARPEVASVGLPGEPEALLLRFEAVEELPEEEDLQQCGSRSGETCFDARVRVILQDGAGLLHRVDAGELIENVGAFQLEVDLTAAPTGGRAPNPHYPLSVVNIEVQSQLAEFSSSVVGLRLMEMSARQPSGAEEPVALVRGDWVLETSLVVGAFTRPEFGFDPTAPPDALAFEIETGSGYGVAPAYFSIRPAGTVLPDTFPVVVSDGFPKTFFAGVGEEINLPPLRISDSEASITGTIATFPTVDPALGEFVVADLATIQMMSYEPGFGLANVDSYWLATGEGETAAIAALRSPPLSSMQVSSSQELTDSLVSDPVALGTIGALTVGFVAAAMFAAVGFAVSATVSARERLIEFALLRALGLSRRQLGAWLIVEQGVLVVMSLALGTLVGIVLTAVILPLIALTQDGRAAVPDVIVIYPWRAVLGLELAVVSVLGAIVAVLTALLRRIGLGSLLRLGDDS